MTLPALLLRVEGLALAAAAVTLYFHEGFGLWLFLALVLAPDLTMVAYLAGPRAGALAYDVAHTTALPLALGAAGVLGGADLCVQLALVWATHIGVDRLIGYGLKYPSAFKDTHLQRV